MTTTQQEEILKMINYIDEEGENLPSNLYLTIVNSLKKIYEMTPQRPISIPLFKVKIYKFKYFCYINEPKGEDILNSYIINKNDPDTIEDLFKNHLFVKYELKTKFYHFLNPKFIHLRTNGKLYNYKKIPYEKNYKNINFLNYYQENPLKHIDQIDRKDFKSKIDFLNFIPYLIIKSCKPLNFLVDV